MNRSRKLIVLFGVLVIVCGVTFSVARYEEHKENIKNSDEIITRIDKDSVTALSWKTETTELSFSKNEVWTYNADVNFPVDEEKIEELLEIFNEFGVSFSIEDVEDYSQYGLDNPVCTIEITTTQKLDAVKSADELDSEAEEAEEATETAEETGETKDTEAAEKVDSEGAETTAAITSTADESDSEKGTYTYKIFLGDYSKMDAQRYVSIGDGKVYLVSTDPYEQFNVELKDMIRDDEIPSFGQVDSIRFEGDVEYNITYREESGESYNPEDVYFTEGEEGSLPLDTSLINTYLSNISYLSLNTYVTYNATEEELASYGMDNPDLTVTVGYSYENEDNEKISDTFVLEISRDPEEKAKAEKQEAEEAESENNGTGTDYETNTVTAYLRIGDSQIVYELDGSDYEELMKAAYNDLRHQSIFYGSFDDIYQMEFTLDDETYIITSEEEEEERVYYYESEKLELSDIMSTIMALTASEFTDEAVSDKEEIRIKLNLDNGNFPEIEIILYRYDGEYCLAVVNGETVAKVSRSEVVDIIEAVNAVVLNKTE